MIEDAKVYSFIERLSHRGLAWFQRFSKAGHPLFDDRLPFHRHFNQRFALFGSMTPAISKEIGHDEKTEKKTDILLETTDEGMIGFWLTWSDVDLEWYIQKWIAGYTTAVSENHWLSCTEGVRAWIEDDYEMEKVDGVYAGDY